MPRKPANGDHPSPETRREPADDKTLWRRVAQSVKPLASRKPAPVFPPSAPVMPAKGAPAQRSYAPVPRPVGPPARMPAKPPPELRHDAAPGLDRATNDRLRRGQMAIDGRLDLHGMDREQAHRALDRFLEVSAAQGRRCLLLVTGKSGVLRAEAPRWLNQAPNRGRLIAFTPAQPRHGGTGALYLLLKRQRET